MKSVNPNNIKANILSTYGVKPQKESILDSIIKSSPAEGVSGDINEEDEEMCDEFNEPSYLQEEDALQKGGKAAVAGEVRTWNGKKYKKQANGKWLQVSESHGMTKEEHRQQKVMSASTQRSSSPDTFKNTKLHAEQEKNLDDKEYDESELSEEDKAPHEFLSEDAKSLLFHHGYRNDNSAIDDADSEDSDYDAKDIQQVRDFLSKYTIHTHVDPDEDEDMYEDNNMKKRTSYMKRKLKTGHNVFEYDSGDLWHGAVSYKPKFKLGSGSDKIEKGGKSAVIGEIRKFGGREYIKTSEGWKFHGKGTGIKAQEHKAAMGTKSTGGWNKKSKLAEGIKGILEDKTSKVKPSDIKVNGKKVNVNKYKKGDVIKIGDENWKFDSYLPSGKINVMLGGRQKTITQEEAGNKKESEKIPDIKVNGKKVNVEVEDKARDVLKAAGLEVVDKKYGTKSALGDKEYPKGTITVWGGSYHTHSWHDSQDHRIPSSKIQAILKQNNLESKYDIKTEKYDPGSEKGWKVEAQYHYLIPIDSKKDKVSKYK